jgi:hypothetical protein
MSGSVQIAVTEPPVYVDANDRFHGTADIAGPGLAGRSPMTAAKGAELTQPTRSRHSPPATADVPRWICLDRRHSPAPTGSPSMPP